MQFELIMIFWDPKKGEHVTYTCPTKLDAVGVKETIEKMLGAWGRNGLRLIAPIILPTA